MRISFDAGKRLSNIAKHGSDFDTAQEVFDHPSIEIPDRRFDYGEDRFRTIGHLRSHGHGCLDRGRWRSTYHFDEKEK